MAAVVYDGGRHLGTSCFYDGQAQVCCDLWVFYFRGMRAVNPSGEM
jgi:hypothetical protein